MSVKGSTDCTVQLQADTSSEAQIYLDSRLLLIFSGDLDFLASLKLTYKVD